MFETTVVHRFIEIRARLLNSPPLVLISPARLDNFQPPEGAERDPERMKKAGLSVLLSACIVYCCCYETYLIIVLVGYACYFSC